MKKLVALSIVSAMALTLGACAKTDSSANGTDNAANEAVAVDANLTTENVTADNVVVADNAIDALNAANAANTAEANTTNSN